MRAPLWFRLLCRLTPASLLGVQGCDPIPIASQRLYGSALQRCMVFPLGLFYPETVLRSCLPGRLETPQRWAVPCCLSRGSLTTCEP